MDMETYTVYGDLGDSVSETILYTSDSLNDATRWAHQYVRWGDFGGYKIIEVVEQGEGYRQIHATMHTYV